MKGYASTDTLSAKYLLHQRIHDDGYKVVLTGEGADEAFGGYAHLQIEHWRSTGEHALIDRLSASNRTSRGMMIPDGATLDLTGVKRQLGYTPAWMEAKAALGRRLHELLCDDFLAEFRRLDPFAELADAIGVARRTNDTVEVSSRLWARSALPNYILATLGDGTEMAPFGGRPGGLFSIVSYGNSSAMCLST